MPISEPIERLSPYEQAFDVWRRRLGAILAPVAFLVILTWPWALLDFREPYAWSSPAQRLGAVMATVAILWIGETLPMPVTALAGAATCVALRVAPAAKVFGPFADQLMFLFIGSFILSRAIFLHGLDKRLAFGVLSLAWVDARPKRVLFMFGAVTAFMSAWISNTATTAMMFAIGMSLLRFMFEPSGAGQKRGNSPDEKNADIGSGYASPRPSGRIDPRYATGMMLMTSFAASIGGLATPIGTPPNVIGMTALRNSLNVEIHFLQWCVLGVPVVLVLFLFLAWYLNLRCPSGIERIEGGREMLLSERNRLGPWTTGQVSTLIAFGVTVILWLTPGVIALVMGAESPASKAARDSLPEGVSSLVGAVLLFLLPGGVHRRPNDIESNGPAAGESTRAMTWREATQIDWGVVLLYGGGFSLGVLANETGLAAAIGEWLTRVIPFSGEWSILIASTLIAALLSEVTSNTASATIIVPVVIAFARAAGVDPLPPGLGATLGASLGFMLPVSTPCNAIVYGSGYVPLLRMARHGLVLDLVGVATIVVLVGTLSRFIH